MSAKIIPTLRYDDAPAAIDWLCRAFGFAPHLVVPGEHGMVEHAQLTLEGAMIMLSSVREGDFDRWQKGPAAAGGLNTQSAYVIVADVDGHCDRAREAGAEILQEPLDQDYGGRLYTCRDPEGYLWSFGSYDPWQ